MYWVRLPHAWQHVGDVLPPALRFLQQRAACLHSHDTSASIAMRCVQAQRLNFPLLTDQSEFLRRSFGIKSDWLGMLPGRQTYVIDKAGKVVLSFNDQVGSGNPLGLMYKHAPDN